MEKYIIKTDRGWFSMPHLFESIAERYMPKKPLRTIPVYRHLMNRDSDYDIEDFSCYFYKENEEEASKLNRDLLFYIIENASFFGIDEKFVVFRQIMEEI